MQNSIMRASPSYKLLELSAVRLGKGKELLRVYSRVKRSKGRVHGAYYAEWVLSG